MSIVSEDEIVTYIESSGATMPARGQMLISSLQPIIETTIEKVLGFKVSQATFVEYHPESQIPNAWDQEPLITGYEMFGGKAVAKTWGQRALGVLQLRQLPVRSITEIRENLAAWQVGVSQAGDWPDSTIIPSTEYMFDQSEPGWSMTGHVIRKYSSWTSDPRCIRVTYVAGLTSGELAGTYSAIKLATLIAIASAYGKAVARGRAALAGGFVGNVHMEDFSIDLTPFLPGQNGESSGLLPEESILLLNPFINLSRWFGR